MITTDPKNLNGYAVLLDTIEAICESSFETATMEDIKLLFGASTRLGCSYPFLAAAIQTHLSWVKQCNLNSSESKIGGHVYAVEYVNGMVKIGKTMNPEQRMATLRSMSSDTVVRHFMSARTIEPHRFEAIAHKHFKSSRKHGEFFSISMNEAINFISQIIPTPNS